MKKLVKYLVLSIILVTSEVYAERFCFYEDTGERKGICEAALHGFYAGAFYFLGKNSAEYAGGVQGLMWLGIASKGSGNTAGEKILLYSLPALALYNFSVLSDHDDDENGNKKAANFNAAAMLIWSFGAEYIDKKRKNRGSADYSINLISPEKNYLEFLLTVHF